MSESAPSCIRAPPEAANNTTGNEFASCIVEKPRQFFADHHTHATAHEFEVHDRERDRMLLDTRGADHHRVVAAARFARCLEATWIRLAVDELERVADRNVGEHLAPASTVGGD